jgi:Lon-like protease
MVTPTEPEAHRAEATSTDAAVPPPLDAGEGAPPGPPPPTPPEEDPAARARRRRRRALGWLATLLPAAFLLGAAFVPLPYYLFKPGSVRDVQPLITVNGDTPTFPAKGTIGYTTVSLRQATLFGLVQGWLDKDIDVIGRDEVLQGRNVKQNEQLNLQMMVNSKQVATQVALQHLGYEVHVTVGQAVEQVEKGTPADGVLAPGDVIVSVDGEAFDDPDDMTRILKAHKPGDTVTLGVRPHDGSATEQVKIKLAPSPDDPNRGIMGVRVTPIAVDYDFPVDISIDTGNVGGPSAGLAFTLGIIDDLTPGELTGGHDVAVTGTMAPDGTVGPVGGTGQKAAAVREKGIKLFIVPRDDYKDAIKHAGKSLKVVPVDNLDQALKVLADQGGNGLHLPQVGKAPAQKAA